MGSLGGFATSEQEYDYDHKDHEVEFAHSITPSLGLGLKPPVVSSVSMLLYHGVQTMYSFWLNFPLAFFCQCCIIDIRKRPALQSVDTVTNDFSPVLSPN